MGQSLETSFSLIEIPDILPEERDDNIALPRERTGAGRNACILKMSYQ
jgi:hypothetical protein